MGGNKVLAVVTYITWIGWLVALLARDKDDELVKQHLNQALVLNLISTVLSLITNIGGVIAMIAGFASLAVFVFVIWGIVRAVKGSAEPLPLIGELILIK